MFGWGRKRLVSSLTGEWAKAQEIALPWLKRHWRYRPKQVEAEQQWPYMLRFDTYRTVLVHDGDVIESGAGLEALAGYLRGIRFLEREDLDAELVLEIVGYFDAYGPDRYRTDYYQPRTRAPAELYPRLEVGADGAKLVLHYQNRIDAPPGVCVLRPDHAIYFLDRWTLTIPRDYALSWKSEYVELRRPPEFR